MQNQQNPMNFDPMSAGAPVSDQNASFNGDTNASTQMDYLNQSQASTSNPLFPLSYPSPNPNSIFLPPSPRFSYSQPAQNGDASAGTSDALFFPYDVNPALQESSEDIGKTFNSTQNIQNSVDQAQLNLDALMREIIRLNPNAFTTPADNQTNGDSFFENDPRVEDLGEDAMLNEIGLPSVNSAVANANAAAAAGNVLSGVGGGGDSVDIDSFFNSLNDSSGNIGGSGVTDGGFDASQFLKSEAYATPEPAPIPLQPPQPKTMTLDAPLRSGRSKRKSDASPADSDDSGLGLQRDGGDVVVEQPPAKKLRARRKLK